MECIRRWRAVGNKFDNTLLDVLPAANPADFWARELRFSGFSLRFALFLESAKGIEGGEVVLFKFEGLAD